MVRDSGGGPLAGAEVQLADKRTLTTPQGAFRLDSLPLGNHLITIRLVGYAPLRSPIVVRIGTWHYTYVLRPATQQLPTLYAEARRSGIYGTVGDTSYQPLTGIRVQVAGKGGGEAVTDSSGRFSFPGASQGQYLVRAFGPGYREERVFVEIRKQEGVEVAIRLRPSREIASRAEEVAIHDLSRRLVANLPGDRLNAGQLKRYESLPLCEVNQVAAAVKRGREDSLTIILNGTLVLEGRSVSDLCSWRASEVELLEFGDSICRDVTRTLVDLVTVWCVGFRKQLEPPRGRSVTRDPSGIGVTGRIKAQRQPGPFVVIWERP
jgi:hypothetical protein